MIAKVINIQQKLQVLEIPTLPDTLPVISPGAHVSYPPTNNPHLIVTSLDDQPTQQSQAPQQQAAKPAANSGPPKLTPQQSQAQQFVMQNMQQLQTTSPGKRVFND